MSKVANGVGVLVQVSGSISLVSSVEHGDGLLGIANIRNHLPLIGVGINASWVVCNGVKDEHTALRSSLQVSKHPIDVKLHVLSEVTVAVGLKASLLEDLMMISPSGVANVHRNSWLVDGQELGSNTKSSSAGEGLHDSHLLLLDQGRILAKDHSRGDIQEGLKTLYGEILLVHLAILSILENLLLSVFDASQNPGLAGVVTVSADTKVHLLLSRISVVCNTDTQDGVGGCLLNMAPERHT
mmetsp:Transcript_7017/g.24483  ORF Transcript_7017/g.24483 Transcript_7017/m.24483 type:complete len:241 (+) Transcript_7017:614-1336(+)